MSKMKNRLRGKSRRKDKKSKNQHSPTKSDKIEAANDNINDSNAVASKATIEEKVQNLRTRWAGMPEETAVSAGPV